MHRAALAASFAFAALFVLAAAPAAALPDTARMLAGHATGPAVACINQNRFNKDTTVVNSSVILFKVGRQLYRNDIAPACAALRADRAIITHEYTSQICSGDIFDVFDAQSRTTWGACSLGQFTPYELPPAK